MQPRPFRLGERIEEPPCVGDDELARCRDEEGRPCPRVELDPDNEIPFVLVTGYGLQEHTRPMFDTAFRAHCAELPVEEQQSILGRVSRALRSRAVVDRLYPSAKPRDEEPNG